MRNELGHPLSIFINIDSEETYIEECTTQTESTVAGFAIKLIDGEVQALEQRNA
jgi:ArsR family metal-binding transcriptional regulator